LSPAYLVELESGLKSPSTVVARRLIAGLEMDAPESAMLLAAAVTDAGLDHPLRYSA
jgi:hypothetical protein